jgi:hypothetical protein
MGVKCLASKIPIVKIIIHIQILHQLCQRLYDSLNDILFLFRMFGAETDDNMMTPEGFRNLLYTSYKLSMDHYPEGPQTCLMVSKKLNLVATYSFI